MKNMGKILGIVAILAMIVLAVGCSGPADPEDQVIITVTDIGSDYENQYAYVALIENIKADKIEFTAYSTVSKKITGGIVSCEMTDEVGPWGKDENLYVAIYINKKEDPNDTDNRVYVGFTSSPKAIVKGPSNYISAKDFYPDTILSGGTTVPEDAEDRVASFVGTYKASYKPSSASSTIINETIVLTVDSFKISDDTKTTNPDNLVFKIESWDYAKTPSKYMEDYPNAFIFKGRILKAVGYIGSNSQTGKGIETSDIKEDGTGTVCWMYLYFNNNGKVIRTPFTKTGATTENTDVVLHYTSTTEAPPLRIYTKQ